MRRIYLEKALGALGAEAEKAAKAFANHPELKKNVPEYERIATAARAVALGDLDAAQTGYDELAADLAELLKPSAEAMSGESVKRELLAGLSLILPPAPPELPEISPAAAQSEIAALDDYVERGDRWAALIVGGFATVGGLQAFWVGKASFGSLGEYIALAFWGFGLHLVSASELSDLVGKLGKAASRTQIDQ